MVDLLAICAHPDDLEVCAAGIFLKAKREGKKTGLIVMTRGEAGGHADMADRLREGEEGARLLGLDYFQQLTFPDAALRFGDETIDGLIPHLRACAPRLLLTLHPDDYHPDHKAVSQIVDAAAFAAGLNKYAEDGEDWHYDAILHMSADARTNRRRPDILVDISDVIEEKRAVCRAHASQNIEQFALDMARQCGALAGTAYAEGLYVNRQPLTVSAVSGLFRE